MYNHASDRCLDITRIGPALDGGLWLCGLFSKMQHRCIVYSFTDSSDLTFEADIIAANQACEVHVFVSTPDAAPTEYSPQIQIHNWNGEGVHQLAQSLGHKYISLVKYTVRGPRTMTTVSAFARDTAQTPIDQITLQIQYDSQSPNENADYLEAMWGAGFRLVAKEVMHQDFDWKKERKVCEYEALWVNTESKMLI